MPRMLKGIRFFQGNDGQFYFNIVGKNGHVLATSEGYTRRWSCWYGALTAKKALSQPD